MATDGSQADDSSWLHIISDTYIEKVNGYDITYFENLTCAGWPTPKRDVRREEEEQGRIRPSPKNSVQDTNRNRGRGA